MQHMLYCPPLSASGLESNPAFAVVIAYEDFETGKHAKRTYDFLVENLGRDCQFVNQMWKFDVLSIPKLREIAVEDAAKADIVIISSHGDELPEQVECWIESWLEQSLNPLALVALFDRAVEDTRRSKAVRAYLAGVAQRGQMEFFAQSQDWPEKAALPAQIAASASAGLNGRNYSSTLAGVVQREFPVPHWGINE